MQITGTTEELSKEKESRIVQQIVMWPEFCVMRFERSSHCESPKEHAGCPSPAHELHANLLLSRFKVSPTKTCTYITNSNLIRGPRWHMIGI